MRNRARLTPLRRSGMTPSARHWSSNKRRSGVNGGVGKFMKRMLEANFLPFVIQSLNARTRILLVDNNRDFTRSAKLALERTGRYVVWEENDSTKAHQTAQNVQPDLILLDIAMPDIDGGEVAARIQSDPALHRIPIVFLTAP